MKSQVIEICRRLYAKDWLSACDGNVSFRNETGEICMTPSGKHKGFIVESDLASLSVEGKILSGDPSSERIMHLTVYKNCLKAGAVVHAHPPLAIAWSIAFPNLKELPAHSISELILAVGSIPIVPYARPGTQEMGDALLPFLPTHRVMILGRHGALAWGEDLEEAYRGIERLEHTAKTLYYAQRLGGLTDLPTEEVRYLREKRQQGNGITL